MLLLVEDNFLLKQEIKEIHMWEHKKLNENQFKPLLKQDIYFFADNWYIYIFIKKNNMSESL